MTAKERALGIANKLGTVNLDHSSLAMAWCEFTNTFPEKVKDEATGISNYITFSTGYYWGKLSEKAVAVEEAVAARRGRIPTSKTV